jgi:ribosomal-protein-serine acetyltransferase
VDPGKAAELYASIDRNRARLREWLPWATHEYGPADAVRFLEQQVVENEKRTSLTTMIRLDGRLCGSIGLHRIDAPNRASSIGYWVDGDYVGHGIATRACRAILDVGFGDYGLHRIEIRCATGNHRSCAVPQRLGFTEEGVLRDAEWLYDHWVDLRVFSKLEHEWGQAERSPLLR